MATKVPVLGAHIRCFLRHADNHRRHVSGRRSHAQLSMRNLLKPVFKSLLCHNIIPLYVTIRTLAVSSCAHADVMSTFLPISDIVLLFCWVSTVCLCDQVHLISLSYKQADPSQTPEIYYSRPNSGPTEGQRYMVEFIFLLFLLSFQLNICRVFKYQAVISCIKLKVNHLFISLFISIKSNSRLSLQLCCGR